MNGFVESRYAWRGPFDKGNVRRATSTRQTPFSAGQGLTGSPSGFTELVYIATAGQKTFSFNTPDHYGNTAVINTSNWVEVTASGLRFVQDDGTGFGGYTINFAANAITFLWPRGAGEVVLIDIFAGGTPGSTESEIPISQLPLAALLTGAEDVPIIQNGITCRTTATAIGSIGAAPAYLNKILSLVYVAAAAQTVFSLNAPDRYGNVYALTNNNGLQVTAGGNRLVQDDGTGFGGYTINLTNNTVTFLYPLGAGEIVVFDIYGLIAQTISTAASQLRMDVLPIVTQNIFPPLTYTPDGQMIIVFVNRTAFFAAASPPDFAVSGSTITWQSTLYSVPAGAQVTVVYTHH
jgi:hypothetical protein